MSVKKSIDRSGAIFLCLIVALTLVGAVSMQTSASDVHPSPAQDRAKMEENLRVLESQSRELLAKIERERAQIRGMAEKYGTANLESRPV